MKNILSLLTIFLLCSMEAHTEEFIICAIKEHENELVYKFTFPIENLQSLQSTLHFNPDNSIKNVVKLQSAMNTNLKITINNIPIDLEFVSTSSNNRFLKIVFKSKKPEKIQTMSISDNGFTFLERDHSSFDFWLLINEQKRLFKLRKEKTTFKANYSS